MKNIFRPAIEQLKSAQRSFKKRRRHQFVNHNFSVAYISLNDSALIINVFQYLERIDCKAQLFLDSRTDPAEVDAVKNAGINFEFVENEHKFVEGLYGEVAARTKEDWLLILTSDEIPTRNMLSAASKLIERADPTVNCAAFPRRWLYRTSGGDLQQSFAQFIGDDYQIRVIRHREITFRPVVHTCGFDMDQQRLKMIPRECPVYHFDWIVHSRSLRERKLAFYDSIQSGTGQQYEKWYLPENHLGEHFMQFVLDQDVIDFADSLVGQNDEVGWVDKFSRQ